MSISESEAIQLFNKYTELKSTFDNSKSNADKIKLERHKNVIIEKLKYIVYRKTASYKKFHNYEDLNQDGYEALIMGLNNFNPSKGSIFWWLHKYLDTRIARKANAHSVVKVPIKVAKTTPPKIEGISLFAEDISSNPEEIYDKKCKLNDFNKKIENLPKEDFDFVLKFIEVSGSKKSMKDYCANNNITKTQLHNKINKIVKKIKQI